MTAKNVSVTVLLFLAVFLTLEAPLPALEANEPSPPALPVFEWGRCPFEGCTYRQWKVVGRITLYSTWKKSRRRVGELNAGDKVVGVTGVVITFKPGIVRVDTDAIGAPPNNLEFSRGDIILTYAYHGEGETAAWFKGRYYEHFDLTFADGEGCVSDCLATYLDRGHKEWWAQVKLRSGRTAWVLMDQAKFDGVDALG